MTNQLPWRRHLPLYDLIRILFLGVLGYFSFAVLLGILLRLVKTTQLLTPDQIREITPILSSSIQSPVLLLLLLLLFFSGATGHLAQKLGIRCLRRRDLWLAASGLVQIYFFGIASQLLWKYGLETLQIPFVEEQGLTEMLKTMSPVAFGFMIFTIAVAAPICEEIFFRRLLYDLVRRFTGRYANVITSLFFSAIHCFLFGMPLLFLVGFFCQKQYLKSRNLATSMLMHMMFNSITLVIVSLDLKQ